MRLSEIAEDMRTAWNIFMKLMEETRKRDWVAGVLVMVMAVLNAKLVDQLPYIFTGICIWFRAVINGVPFDIMQASWKMPDGLLWIRYYIVPAIIMVLIVFLECRFILKLHWFRIVGGCLIGVYIMASWIVLYPLRCSVDLLIFGNWVFLPVLLIYVAIGIINSFLQSIARD